MFHGPTLIYKSNTTAASLGPHHQDITQEELLHYLETYVNRHNMGYELHNGQAIFQLAGSIKGIAYKLWVNSGRIASAGDTRVFLVVYFLFCLHCTRHGYY